jgi:hypothetical protein
LSPLTPIIFERTQVISDQELHLALRIFHGHGDITDYRQSDAAGKRVVAISD